jgi:hypothetical protein
LFLMPGLFLGLIGFASAGFLASAPVRANGVSFDVGTLAVSCMLAIVGFQLVAFAFFTKVFAIAEGLLPEDHKLSRVFTVFTLERGIVIGLLILLAGVVWLARSVWIWEQLNYGVMPYGENLRRLIPAVTLVVLGVQTIFSSFFMSVLGLKTVSRKPPTSDNIAR